MHILEQYALNCGVKIDQPYICDKFFPVPCEKYITFHPFGKFNSRKYDYWSDVIRLITPYLEKENIKIVQIGGAGEQPLEGCLNIMGSSDFNQSAFIIKNSLLHLGADSFPTHLASYFQRKIVALYCNMYADQSKPYWSKNSDIILLQAELGDNRPSYSPEENPKTINTIQPETIAKSVLSLLGIDNINLFQTIYIGNRYKDRVIETMPDQVIHPEFFKDSVLNIRFDFTDKQIDLSHTAQNLSLRACSIVTEKPFPIELLSQHKANLSCVIYDITLGCDIEFIKKMEQLGIKYACVFNSSKKKNLTVQEIREQLMEYCDVQEINTVPQNIPENLTNSNLKYRSNRVILANQKIYPSRAAQLLDLSVTDTITGQSLMEISKLEEFKEDIEYCYIYSDQA
jgi:hypothetical protein